MYWEQCLHLQSGTLMLNAPMHAALHLLKACIVGVVIEVRIVHVSTWATDLPLSGPLRN